MILDPCVPVFHIRHFLSLSGLSGPHCWVSWPTGILLLLIEIVSLCSMAATSLEGH